MGEYKNPAPFHCHLQSLDTGSSIDDFVKKEIELGSGCLTCTDHGTMSALFIAYTKAKKAGLTFIPGIEAYLRDENCDILKSSGIELIDGSVAHYFKYGHCTLHYIDQKAYETGCKVLSEAPRERHGSETKPIYSWRDLEELGSQNVTAGSGCLVGAVSRHLLADRPDIAEKYYIKYRSLFKPGNFFVELFPHKCTHNWVHGVFITTSINGKEHQHKFYAEKKLKTNVGEITAEELDKEFNKKSNKHTHLTGIKNYRSWLETEEQILKVEYVEDFVRNDCSPEIPDGDVQLYANKWMLDMAIKYRDPVVTSDDCHYANPDDQLVQDVCLAQSGNWRFYGKYHRQSANEMYNHFKETMGISEKQFEEWTENSQNWASRFKEFKFDYKPSLASKFYPEDTLGYLFKLIEKHGRMDWTNKKWTDRLKAEIDMLHRNGKIDLLPYFFPAEEVCEQYALNGQLTGPGRGSAAGLGLSYLLGITHVDPIKNGLSMERFITKDRILSGKLPDIDQDLPDTEFLMGKTVEEVVVEMEDGTVRKYMSDEVINTDQGPLTVHEAVARKADILD